MRCPYPKKEEIKSGAESYREKKSLSKVIKLDEEMVNKPERRI